jgi:hypothetical protein
MAHRAHDQCGGMSATGESCRADESCLEARVGESASPRLWRAPPPTFIRRQHATCSKSLAAAKSNHQCGRHASAWRALRGAEFTCHFLNAPRAGSIRYCWPLVARSLVRTRREINEDLDMCRRLLLAATTVADARDYFFDCGGQKRYTLSGQYVRVGVYRVNSIATFEVTIGGVSAADPVRTPVFRWNQTTDQATLDGRRCQLLTPEEQANLADPQFVANNIVTNCAEVKAISDGFLLNLRQAPTAKAQSITQLKPSWPLSIDSVICEEANGSVAICDDKWMHVTSVWPLDDGPDSGAPTKGWVRARYVQFIECDLAKQRGWAR